MLWQACFWHLQMFSICKKKSIHLSKENENHSSWDNHCHSLLSITSRKITVRQILNCWTDECAENASHRSQCDFIPSIVQQNWCDSSSCLHIQEKRCEYNQDLDTVGFHLIKASVSQNISRVLLLKLGCNSHDNFIASLYAEMKVHVLNHRDVLKSFCHNKLS